MANQSAKSPFTSNGPLWRWTELTEALAAEFVGRPSTAPTAAPLAVEVRGIAFDSRQAQPGDLFIALPGDPGPNIQASQTSDRDGHNFVDAAVSNGAVAAMTHDGLDRAIPQLAVVDTLVGLRALATHRRDRSKAVRIAVTGSSGKTTAKTLLAAALSAAVDIDGPIHASQGSFNNHLGVPLSLATMPMDAVVGVFEIGTNHPGEIEPLSRLVLPSVAVLLNVHSAHVGNFADHQALTQEKLTIAKGLPQGGVLVVEDEVALTAATTRELERRGVRILRFGKTASADVRLLRLEETTSDTRAHYQMGAEQVIADVPGGGDHRALTLAAVLGVLQALQLPMTAALSLSSDLVPLGRGNRREVAGVVVLDDSYNANPESMSAALLSLGQSPRADSRRFAILGDMLELGGESQTAHEALRQQCIGLDGVWLVGQEMAALASHLPDTLCLSHVPAADSAVALQALAEQIVSHLQPGDVVLVKASKRIFWEHKFVDSLIDAMETGAVANG